MRRIVVALSMVGALLATGSGVALAHGHNDRGPRGDHHRTVHHPRAHHPVKFHPRVNHHPVRFHPQAHHPRAHLSWWEQLRLRLFHHR